MNFVKSVPNFIHLRLKEVLKRHFSFPKFVIDTTRHFRKRNWVEFMILNISELELKENGELYMVHGNLNIITPVHLRFS